MTFFEWLEKETEFKWNPKFDFMRDIYECNTKRIILMTGSQVGKTTFLLLKMCHKLIENPGNGIVFFPTQQIAYNFVQHRLHDFGIHGLESKSPLVYRFGESRIVFSSNPTKMVTPYDVVAIDEARLYQKKSINHMLELTSWSKNPCHLIASTAGLWKRDIHNLFLQGLCHHWMSVQGEEAQDLTSMFPRCIKNGKYIFHTLVGTELLGEPSKGQWDKGFWRTRGTIVEDTESFHISQLLTSPANYIWDKWIRAVNSGSLDYMKEFINCTLGLPTRASLEAFGLDFRFYEEDGEIVVRRDDDE